VKFIAFSKHRSATISSCPASVFVVAGARAEFANVGA